jgi:hypothetical protein
MIVFISRYLLSIISIGVPRTLALSTFVGEPTYWFLGMSLFYFSGAGVGLPN